MSKKKNKSKDPEVAFLCDWGACDLEVDCLDCHHTTDVSHAKNFEKVAEGKYMEKEEKHKDEDLVNHPSHYCHGDVETIDKMVIIFGAESTALICLGNCFKYLDRYQFKGHPQQDLEKALWYAKKAYFLRYPDESYEEVSIGIRDFEFTSYSNDFSYRAFNVAKAKRDLVLLNSEDDQKNLARLIRHVEAAVDSQ